MYRIYLIENRVHKRIERRIRDLGVKLDCLVVLHELDRGVRRNTILIDRLGHLRRLLRAVDIHTLDHVPIDLLSIVLGTEGGPLRLGLFTVGAPIRMEKKNHGLLFPAVLVRHVLEPVILALDIGCIPIIGNNSK